MFTFTVADIGREARQARVASYFILQPSAFILTFYGFHPILFSCWSASSAKLKS
jgi:hypothetical protein